MKDLKVFVACHKEFFVPKSKILFPIQVGSFFANKPINEFYCDNVGDNISEKNRSYCELTAIYWMWKNVQAEYYGLFHYRRYLSFNLEHLNIKSYYKTYDVFDDSAAEQLNLFNYDAIDEILGDNDLILPTANCIGNNFKNNYEQYCKSPFLHQRDLDIFLNVIKEKYPFLEDAISQYMNSKYAYYCNIFIMKKELFNEYCTMLFDVLEETERRCDTSRYSIDELRVFGHLAERFLGILVKYWLTKEIKIKNLRMTKYDCVEKCHIEPAFEKNFISIALSANNYYSPYLGVTIQSIIDNADLNHNYDIIVIDGGITQANKDKILFQAMGKKNISIRFYPSILLQKGQNLPTKQHMSIETWYRLFLPYIMPKYDKIIYIDCDLVVNDSLVDLFNTKLSNNLIAATRDLPLIGLYYDNHFVEYFDNVLKLDNAENYIQAGVLILNLSEFRKQYSLSELLDLAFSYDWRWLDQDVMNVLANGKKVFLNQKWNVEIDRAGIRIGQIRHCPIDLYLSYMDARTQPAIVHYSGEQKPWANPNLDMADYFWKYARNSTFSEAILFRIMDAKSAAVTNSVKNLLPPAPIEGKNKKQPKGKKHGVLYRAARKLNPDSKFRLFLKRIYYAFKKDCGPVPNAYWTIDSDIHMHNLITKRKIKKALLLNLFDNEMKKMRAFKNIHKGERCFIACTGPSLLISDLDKLKNEITFGVNSIVRAYEKTDWRPTYYVLVDNYAFGNYLKTTPIKGVALSKEASFLHYRTKLLQPVGNEVYLPIDYHNHTKENMQKEKIKYSSDPSVCVYDGFTVTNMAIQIAIYMGFKDIYIIGADCNYDPKQMHFIETAEIDDKQRNAKYLPNAVLLSIKGYEAMKKFAKKHKVNIYNATRGGKLEVFKRVNLDDMELKNQ